MEKSLHFDLFLRLTHSGLLARNYVPYAQTLACRNFHCDVHVADENKHTLPPFGSLASLSIAMAFSR